MMVKNAYSGGKAVLLTAGILFFLFVTMFKGYSQIIDENTSQDSIAGFVGNDSLDFIAQSFVADINKAHRFGVWLRQDSPSGQVKISIVADGGGVPDLNTVFRESNLITPAAAGGWVYDSAFTAVFAPGTTYWVVIDGYGNPPATGYSSFGVSDSFPQNNARPYYFTNDAGLTWDSVPGVPMAIYVEGDTCSFVFDITPQNALVCPGNEVELSVPTGFLSYIWSNGSTSSNIMVASPGLYSVTVLDADLCTSEAYTSVYQAPMPQVNLDTVYHICENESQTLSVSGLNTIVLWSTGETTSNIVVSTPGNYTVQAVNQFGCRAYDTTDIYLHILPSVSLGNDTAICAGDTLDFKGPAGYSNYSWSYGDIYFDSVRIFQSGSLFLTIFDSVSCFKTSDTLNVTVNPLPDEPELVYLDGIITSSFDFGYQWILDGNAIPGEKGQSIVPSQPGQYSVIVTNGYGCRIQSDTFIVILPPGEFISQGISPNGDGLNEYFYIEGAEAYPDNIVQIFNRWGQLVYEKESYNNDWMGVSMNGGDLPDGNYYYYYDKGDGSPMIKGVVLINR